jgi:hypothetical protein
MCAVEEKSMSLINPISPVAPRPIGLPESTGVLGFQAPPPVLTANIFQAAGASRGGTETTGVNSFSSGSSGSSSGGGGGLNVLG